MRPDALAESDKLYKAHLISEDEWISRKAQIAQLGVSALSLKRSSAELEGEKNVLRREIDSYSSLVAPGTSKDGLNSDVLQAKRQLNSSQLDEANAKDLADALYQELSMTDDAIAQPGSPPTQYSQYPLLKSCGTKTYDRVCAVQQCRQGQSRYSDIWMLFGQFYFAGR